MNITWHGQHTLKIVTHGITIVLDPHPPQKNIASFRAKADIVSLSNPSAKEMSHISCIQGSPTIIDTPGEYSLHGITLHARGWRHTDGSERSFQRWRIEDVVLLHLGALTRRLTTEELQVLEQIPIDVLFLPINGSNSLSPQLASELLTIIEPRLVIPTNYTTITAFAKTMGINPRNKQPKLTINTRNLLPEGLATVILSP